MLVAFSLLLALNQVVIKVSTGGFQPVFLAGMRSFLAMLVLMAWMRLRNIPMGVPVAARWPAVLLGVLFAYEFVCLFVALDYTTVGRASIMFYTMPVWTTVGAHLLIPGERMTRRRVLGLILAMAGVTVALLDRTELGPNALWGDLLALTGALGWAGIALTVRATPASRLKPEQQLFWQLAISGPILLLLAPLFGELLRDPEPIHYAGLAFQVLAVASMGYLFWFWLMGRYPASGVASFGFLTPVFSVFLGWVMLGEHIGVGVFVGLLMVAMGLILINRR